MKVYQIDYDLRKQRNYEALHERIKTYGYWCRPLESSWLVATNQSAAQVRDHLKAAMDRDDGLLVTRLQGEAAWTGLDPRVEQWLNARLGLNAA